MDFYRYLIGFRVARAEVEQRVLDCGTVDRSIRDEPYKYSAGRFISEPPSLIARKKRAREREGLLSVLHAERRVSFVADRIICRDRSCASTSHTAASATMSKDRAALSFFFSVVRKRAPIADTFNECSGKVARLKRYERRTISVCARALI